MIADTLTMDPAERKVGLSIRAHGRADFGDFREYMTDSRGSFTSIGEMVPDFGAEKEAKRKRKSKKDRYEEEDTAVP